VDSAGNVFIADQRNYCVRKVSPDGIIRTVAGNGEPGYSGDGGPAAEARLNMPSGLALDSAGNLFIADGSHVHKVTPAGIITTVAGTYGGGASGDDGPALKATFAFASGVAVDSGGNIYVADAEAHRVGEVGRDGNISTVAGTGEPGFSGDGLPAARAQLRRPWGVAVDAAGILYIADSYNRRIRRVSSSGVITTVAGSGVESGYAGEGGPATQASLSSPYGVTPDQAGNLYIADTFFNAVRKIGPDGRISTVAGSGEQGFRGDGGLAAAWLATPFGVALDRAGNLYIADTDNDRIRVVSASAPAFNVSSESISERTLSGGPAVPAGTLNLAASVPGLPFTARAGTRDGGGWLSVEPEQGNMPAGLQLIVNPAKLTPGVYEGIVSIVCPPANPAVRTVSVKLTVTDSRPAQLALETRGLSFPFGKAGGASSASAPAVLTVAANPGALGAGTYSGTITVRPAAGPVLTVAVSMTITGQKPRILLSQTGLSFKAVAGGGAMSWSVKASALSGGSWLALSGAGGRVEKPLLDVSMVDVSVNPSGLSAGIYYGRIEVAAAAGLVFTGVDGGGNPGSQDIQITNLHSKAANYISSRATFGGVWVNYRPASATVSPGSSNRIVVQPDFASLAPGVYRGAITLPFDDGTPPQNVELLTVLASRAAAGASRCRSPSRAPTATARRSCRARDEAPWSSSASATAIRNLR
jgi:hypothetical protein